MVMVMMMARAVVDRCCDVEYMVVESCGGGGERCSGGVGKILIVVEGVTGGVSGDVE